MKTVYRLTPRGWVRCFTCQSFEHACKVARQLMALHSGMEFCVNS